MDSEYVLLELEANRIECLVETDGTDMGGSGIPLEKMGRSEERRVGKECLRLCRSRWSPYH